MKTFQQRELVAAVAHAAAGGQALHLFEGAIADASPGAPACFRGRKLVGHLFDQDLARLCATARRLGIRVIFVDRKGTDRQHIDLCGKPLDKAIALAELF